MGVQNPIGRRMVSHVREWVATAMRLHIYSGLVKSALFFWCAVVCSLDCCLPGSSVCGIFQARTGAVFHFLLQGIFLTQWSNLYLFSPVLADGFFTTNTTWELVHKLRKTEPSFSRRRQESHIWKVRKLVWILQCWVEIILKKGDILIAMRRSSTQSLFLNVSLHLKGIRNLWRNSRLQDWKGKYKLKCCTN